MKTLFERLKPELMTILNEEAITYPSTIKLLIENLHKYHTPFELSINDAYRLTMVYETRLFGIDEIFNCFNEL
jgi:hypothetical protein